MVPDFWNKVWAEFEPFELNPVTFREETGPSNKMLLNLIGDVRGKSVLDIGCGNGLFSVYLAKMGGKVTAIDNSIVAVKNTMALAKVNQVDSLLEIYRLNATESSDLNKHFDLVVGNFILHHIEPFDVFSEVLFNIIRKRGRGIFLENNSRNPILMFFRTHVVGRFGIPKYGDKEEYPLRPQEVQLLKRRFKTVLLHYPDFAFFRLIVPYLFKYNRKLVSILRKMDEWFYSYWPILHKYSYHQIIEVRKS